MRRLHPTDRVPPSGHGLRRRLGLAALGAALAVALPASPRLMLEGQALTPGMRVDERLAAGECRRYPVPLRAGEYLRVVVSEEGGDVEVRLLASDDTAVAHADGPKSPEDEELAAVAPREGTYRLEIGSAQPGKPGGRYLLQVADLRSAGERDRRRARALAVTQEADDEAAQKDRAGWRRQLATRERSLALWRSLGDERRATEALLRMGELRLNLGENQPAAELLHRALAGYRAAGDRGGVAEALNEAGIVDIRLLRHREAMEHFDEALPLARAAADQGMELNLQDNRGRAFCRLGRPREAMRPFGIALAFAQTRHDTEREARVLNNLGAAYATLGERQTALDYYRQALEICRRRQELASLEATAWNNLGESHEELGEWEEAEEEQRSALQLFRTLGERQHEALSLSSLARVERRLGRYADAARDLSSAIELDRRLGEPGSLDSAAIASTDLAFLDLERNEPAAALAAAEQAQSLAPADGEAKVTAWHALGAARLALGDLPGAADALERALAASQARGNLAFEADARFLLAKTARARGDLDGAAAQAEAALATIESLRARVAAEGLRTSFVASSQRFYELAIELLMELEAARPAQGFAARALAVAERARARSLLDLLAEAGAEPRGRTAPELVAREQRARQEVSSAESHRHELLREVPPAPAVDLAAAARAVDRAVAAYDTIEAELADRSPSYASLVQPRPLSSEEIARQVLDSDTVLLEFALGERRSYLWALADGTLTAYELPPRNVIEDAARRFYGLLTARNLAPPGETPAQRRARLDHAHGELPAAARALSDMLLGPAAQRLGRRRLAVVADGLLQYVPFVALPEPGLSSAAREPLVAGHEVVTLPSASVLAVLRREISRRPPAPHLLAILADPVFSRDDPRVSLGAPPMRFARRGVEASSGPRGGAPPGIAGIARAEEETATFAPLHFSRLEAERIAALVPANERLVALGFDASRATALSGVLARYRYVHFATHAEIDSRQPKLSGLVLSMVDRRGRPQDGFLRLADVYDLELRADLVVLSACRTALGKEMRGEGLIGLTRGFMHAGAARVLASLWSVDDRATSELMARFYRSMLVDHRTPAAALREAQLSMARDPSWAAPEEWAGFSLQGEWR